MPAPRLRSQGEVRRRSREQPAPCLLREGLPSAPRADSRRLARELDVREILAYCARRFVTRHSRAWGQRRAGSESGRGTKSPTDESGRPAAHHRLGAQRCRPCAGRHTRDRSRGPCTRMRPAIRGRSPSSALSRNRRSVGRIAGSDRVRAEKTRQAATRAPGLLEQVCADTRSMARRHSRSIRCLSSSGTRRWLPVAMHIAHVSDASTQFKGSNFEQAGPRG